MIVLETSVTTDESRLIAEAGRGSIEAFGQIVRLHQSSIRAHIAVRLTTPGDIDDLAQETFITAWNKISGFDPEQSLIAWLKTIALNLVLNHRRKFRAHAIGGHAELETLIHSHSYAEDAPESEQLANLIECLSRLEGPARKLIEAHYTEGRSLRDIAKSTGRGYSAVTMQVHRLRELLAECVTRAGQTTKIPA